MLRTKAPSAAEAAARMPLLAAVTLVPLIVYLRAVPLDEAVARFWSGPKTHYDFFSYYKATALIPLAAASLLAALTVRRHSLGRLFPALQAALVAGYAALALASTVASPFPAIAWQGFVDRYEGFWVLAAYLALLVSAYALFDRAMRLRTFAWCLACSATVISAIGLMQRAGLDPFRTGIGKAAILPGAFESRIDSMTFRLPEGSTYSTLGHYNYVGSYAALVLPLFVSLALGSEPTKLRTVSRIAGGMLAAVWIVCGSRAGLVGGAFSGVVLLIALRPHWQKHVWRIALGLLVAVALVAVARPRLLGNVAERASAGIVNLLAPIGAAERSRLESLPVRAASIVGNGLRLETRRGELVLVNQNGSLSVADDTGRALEVLVEGSGRVTITDERFSGFELLNGTLHGRQAIVVKQGPFVMRFALTPGGFDYVSEGGRVLPLGPVAAWGGKGHEDAASARVYIWSRTIPLLRHTILLGYGPDTFAATFPQHDFTGKYLAYGTTEMLVDKPHNLYLQAALNTGLLSVLFLIGLFLSYAIGSCRVYWMRMRRDEPWRIGVGCSAGVVGYLGAATFNDSVVSVAPLFWVMLGAGMSALALSVRSEPAASRNWSGG